MFKQFRYILLFCIMLFCGFSAMAQFAMPDNVCIGAEKHYNVDPNPLLGSTYTWKINKVTQGTFTANFIDITWNTAGTFLLEVQELSIGGCPGLLISGQVFVHPAPAAIAGTDKVIYLNASIQLGAASVHGSTYSWSSLPVGFTSTEANPIVTPLVTTSFTLQETINATGCTAANNVVITVISQNLPPVAVDDYDTTQIYIPVNINILRNDYDPNGEIASVTLCGGPFNGLATLNLDNTITYSPKASFTGIDSLCYFICNNVVPVLCDTANVYIFVSGGSIINWLIIYNVITPNDDGDNDKWIIDGIEEFPDNSVVIFNRWGDKIYSHDRYDNKTVVWEGTDLGSRPVPDGTYYYILTIKDEGTRTGWIFVRRGSE